jgi:hypothetical protein
MPPPLIIRRQLWLIVGVALLGCARDRPCRVCTEAGGIPASMAEDLPPVEMTGDRPPSIEPDLAGLPDRAAVNAALEPDSEAAPTYRELTAPEAQCRAAQTAPRANALQAERRAVQPSHGIGSAGSERSTSLQRELLAIAAVEDRNRSAGAALEVFYHLAEAEARGAVLERSLAANDQALRALRQLSERGLPLPVNEDALLRQRLGYEQQQVQLELTISQLNEQLRHLTGFEAIGERWRFWPSLAWQVTVERVDVDEAVSLGLALRPELVLLRTLETRLDADTLPVARQVASIVDGLLGASTGRSCLLAIAFRQLTGRISPEEAQEVSARRKQIREYRQDRERGVATEIRQAAATMEAELRRVSLTKEEVTSLSARIRNLEALRLTGGATAFDVTTAELELLRAQSDLIARVIAWKIAVVKLKEAQGLLAEECGWVAAGGAGGHGGCCP